MIKINPTNIQLNTIIKRCDLVFNKQHASGYNDLYNNFDQGYTLLVVVNPIGYRSVYVSENLFTEIANKSLH